MLGIWANKPETLVDAPESNQMDHRLDEQTKLTKQPVTSITELNWSNVSQIEMLEMEIEGLSADLHEERNLATIRQMECEKHSKHLSSVERELASCRSQLDVWEQKSAHANAEVIRQARALTAIRVELQRSPQPPERSVQAKQAEQHTEVQTKIKSHRAKVQEAECTQTIETSELLATIRKHKTAMIESQKRYDSLNQLHEDYKVSSEAKIAELDREYRAQEADLIIKNTRTEKEMWNVKALSMKERKEAHELRRQIRDITRNNHDRDDEVRNLEFHLNARDVKIVKLTRDVETLQIKAKKVPGLASQVARLEADAAALTIQLKGIPGK